MFANKSNGPRDFFRSMYTNVVKILNSDTPVL
jgi:hypothetical protein